MSTITLGPRPTRKRAVKSRARHLVAGHRARAAILLADERGSQITDNLGLIVIGIVTVVAIGGLISGLDTTIFNWISGQLGLSS